MYCKSCKHNVQEEHLYNDRLCPACGRDIYVEPIKMAKRVRNTHTVMCVFVDRTTGVENSVVYDGVTDWDYNRLVNESLNVLSVTKLVKGELT